MRCPPGRAETACQPPVRAQTGPGRKPTAGWASLSGSRASYRNRRPAPDSGGRRPGPWRRRCARARRGGERAHLVRPCLGALSMPTERFVGETTARRCTAAPRVSVAGHNLRRAWTASQVSIPGGGLAAPGRELRPTPAGPLRTWRRCRDSRADSPSRRGGPDFGRDVAGWGGGRAPGSALRTRTLSSLLWLSALKGLGPATRGGLRPEGAPRALPGPLHDPRRPRAPQRELTCCLPQRVLASRESP